MTTFLLIFAAGLAGGFIAGMVGVGGGVIFSPVLLLTLQSTGVTDPVLTPLTLGSSLLCTLAASASGAVSQWRRGAVALRTAVAAGGAAALAVTLMTVFVTTQPDYDRQVFRVVLGCVLLIVVARMLLTEAQRSDGEKPPDPPDFGEGRRSLPALGGVGALAGTLASAAGIGGGVVLVPAFSRLVRLPMLTAAGTSTLSIVWISLVGVIVYTVRGLGADVPPGALGYVCWPYALALAVPALFTARLGVRTAHRIDVRWVRRTFALLAFVIACRLLWASLA